MSWPFRLLFNLLIGYLVLVVAVFLLQRKLLYLPGSGTLDPRDLASEGLSPWPSQDDYRGLIHEPEGPEIRGTVIVFHGNAGSAIDRLYYSRALGRLGFRVLLAEYPGYGARAGRPSEALLVADARASIAELAHRHPGPVYLWGESLGAGVAAAVVADAPVGVDGLVLLTPWSSLADLAQSIHWYLPARWLLLDRYDSVANLAAWDGPLAMIAAAEDEIIPGRFSQKLFDAYRGDKRLWRFEGAGHNSWPISPELSWWGDVMDYLESNGRR